jgi:hypothetical protein
VQTSRRAAAGVSVYLPLTASYWRARHVAPWVIRPPAAPKS